MITEQIKYNDTECKEWYVRSLKGEGGGNVEPLERDKQ
jgi:hypothetical protein